MYVYVYVKRKIETTVALNETKDKIKHSKRLKYLYLSYDLFIYFIIEVLIVYNQALGVNER